MPLTKAWLDEYGGTWGRVTPQDGDDPYYFYWNAWLTFAADMKGQVQIKGQLYDRNSEGVFVTCSVSPPSSFAVGPTQWTWPTEEKETCALRIKRMGDDLSVDFSGCPKSCTSVTGFNDLRLHRLSTQPMQSPTGSSIIGLCVSDNIVVRQLCLSPKLRESLAQFLALRKQADGAVAENLIPPDGNQLVLQLARDCKDIGCVEDAQERINRELHQRIDQALSETTSVIKFAPLRATLYRGTFGGSEATACLAVNDNGGLDGGYYDEKWGKMITLSRAEPSTQEQKPRVTEGSDMEGYRKGNDGKNSEWHSGVWRFDQLNADELRGRRRDLRNGDEIAVHMQKTATVAADTACEQALSASRHLVERIIERWRVGGIEFVTYGNQWTDGSANDSEGDGIVGLRIESGLGAVERAAINKELKESVDNANNVWFTCKEMSFSQHPILLTKTYLTIREDASNYCGGTHTYFGSAISVFDLRTGKSVDINKWVNQAALEKSEKKGAIRQAIEGYIDGQCLDALDQTNWQLDGNNFWMAKEGVMFSIRTSSPPLLMCVGDYAVNFATFRKVVSATARTLYDHYVDELKKGEVIKSDSQQ